MYSLWCAFGTNTPTPPLSDWAGTVTALISLCACLAGCGMQSKSSREAFAHWGLINKSQAQADLVLLLDDLAREYEETWGVMSRKSSQQSNAPAWLRGSEPIEPMNGQRRRSSQPLHRLTSSGRIAEQPPHRSGSDSAMRRRRSEVGGQGRGRGSGLLGSREGAEEWIAVEESDEELDDSTLQEKQVVQGSSENRKDRSDSADAVFRQQLRTPAVSVFTDATCSSWQTSEVRVKSPRGHCCILQ